MTSMQIAKVPVGSDEKVAQIMAYTTNSLIWGDVVVKEMIRVSTWLRTNAAPDRFPIYNARVLVTTSAAAAKPAVFSELNISVPTVLAFHLAPPGKDPADYDPTEPNRKMDDVSAIVSTFLFKGKLRSLDQPGSPPSPRGNPRILYFALRCGSYQPDHCQFRSNCHPLCAGAPGKHHFLKSLGFEQRRDHLIWLYFLRVMRQTGGVQSCCFSMTVGSN